MLEALKPDVVDAFGYAGSPEEVREEVKQWYNEEYDGDFETDFHARLADRVGGGRIFDIEGNRYTVQVEGDSNSEVTVYKNMGLLDNFMPEKGRTEKDEFVEDITQKLKN